jgi:translation initiation factor IF-2
VKKPALRLWRAEPAQKILREVVIPETITVGELANRMAEPGSEVVKALMKMGVMATITQSHRCRYGGTDQRRVRPQHQTRY